MSLVTSHPGGSKAVAVIDGICSGCSGGSGAAMVLILLVEVKWSVVADNMVERCNQKCNVLLMAPKIIGYINHDNSSLPC